VSDHDFEMDFLSVIVYFAVNSVLWSVVLYASETWSVTEADGKRLEAMEMWIWRRMEKISWVDKISNEEVFLQRINETKTMLDTVGKCKFTCGYGMS